MKLKLEKEDKWVLSRLESVKKEVYESMEKLLPNIAAKALEDFFINDFSRSYIKIIRDRINENKELSILLYNVLFDTIKLMSPFTPFLAEKIYQDLFRKFEKKESVHLLDWSIADKKLIDTKLEKQMSIFQKIIEAVNSERQEKKIKLKYILPMLTVSGDEDVKAAVKSLEGLLKRTANVKEVKFGKLKEGGTEIKLNYKVAGKKFGKDIKEVEKIIADKKDEIKKAIAEDKAIKILDYTADKNDFILRQSGGEGKEFEGGRIFLGLNVTAELKQEWLVRELIRAVQEKRKALGLNQSDKIKLYIDEEIFNISELTKQKLQKEPGSQKLIQKFRKQIEQSTGSQVSNIKDFKGEKDIFDFEGKKFEFGVEK